jgi:hypothetical protein
MYLCHLKKDFWGTRHRHFLWPSTPFSVISSHWPPVVMINVVPFFWGYPMIQFHEPKKREWFTIVIPWFFHSWSHYLVPKWSHILKCLSHDSMVKLLDFMEKSQLFHVQLEKKTRFHFSIDFSHFFCDVWDDLPQLRRRWPGNARANHAAVPAASADGVPWPTECFVAVIPKVTIPLTIVIYI